MHLKPVVNLLNNTVIVYINFIKNFAKLPPNVILVAALPLSYTIRLLLAFILIESHP
jgi:hypothetical protein